MVILCFLPCNSHSEDMRVAREENILHGGGSHLPPLPSVSQAMSPGFTCRIRAAGLQERAGTNGSQMCSLGHQRQQHLRACWKCKGSPAFRPPASETLGVGPNTFIYQVLQGILMRGKICEPLVQKKLGFKGCVLAHSSCCNEFPEPG